MHAWNSFQLQIWATDNRALGVVKWLIKRHVSNLQMRLLHTKNLSVSVLLYPLVLLPLVLEGHMQGNSFF